MSQPSVVTGLAIPIGGDLGKSMRARKIPCDKRGLGCNKRYWRGVVAGRPRLVLAVGQPPRAVRLADCRDEPVLAELIPGSSGPLLRGEQMPVGERVNNLVGHVSGRDGATVGRTARTVLGDEDRFDPRSEPILRLICLQA